MTGYAESAAHDRGFLEQGMELIVKPFSLDALGQRVQHMLAESRDAVPGGAGQG